jgi:biopolymer transport protein ExbD
MIRLRPLIASLALVGLCGSLVGSNTASAGPDPVPRIRNEALCVAGTGGPIAGQDVTHVMAGEIGYFRVLGIAQPQRFDGLVRILQARVGPARPSTHEVWITASKEQMWGHVVEVRNACAKAGIYRVGVRVRHEATGQIMGFPLFLPGTLTATRPSGEGTRLPVEVEPSRSGETSDPAALYDAARTARERFEKPVVADVRMANNVSLQYAIRVLDYLHRAGCAGVRIRMLKFLATPVAAEHSLIKILRPRGKDALLPKESLRELEIPVPAVRTTPWPIDGANEPGAFRLELLELPARGDKLQEPRRYADPNQVLPNHIREGSVPESMRAKVQAYIGNWAGDLSNALTRALREPNLLKKELVVRLRPDEKRLILIPGELRNLGGANRIRMRTLGVDLLFFLEGQPTGHARARLLLSGRSVYLLSIAPVAGALPEAHDVPPEAVDPFAAGVPGAVRVYFESVVLDAKASGRVAQLAPTEYAAALLPPTETVEVQVGDRARQADAARFAAQLRGLRFDRLILHPTDATAIADDAASKSLVGRLTLGMESEEQELRIQSLRARRFR